MPNKFKKLSNKKQTNMSLLHFPNKISTNKTEKRYKKKELPKYK